MPLELRSTPSDHLGELRLGDRAGRLAVLAEIAHLVRYGPGIGRDGDGADRGARIPGDDKFRAVLQVDQNPVASSDAPALKAVLLHNMREEIEHAAMALEWLRRNSPDFNKELRVLTVRFEEDTAL